MIGRAQLLGAGLAIAGAALAVQTVRLEGLRVWPLAIEGARPRAARLQAELDRIVQAQAHAAATAAARKAATETAYRTIAERIDEDAKDRTTDALAVAERFIAAGGMRAAPVDRASGGAAAGADDRGTGGSGAAGAPAQLDGASGGDAAALVTVLPDDVRICTANTLQAEAGRAWGLALGADQANGP